MKSKKNNSTSSGRNGKNPGTLYTLASPPKKTSSAKHTEPAAGLSKTGSSSQKKMCSGTTKDNSLKPKQQLAVPKLPNRANRLTETLKRLKVKPEQLASAPQITTMYKNAEGGLKTVLDAMRYANQDEVIAAFLKKYNAIPEGDRRNVPWEAVAIAAKLDVRTLSGAIMNAIALSSGNTSRLLALTAHPKMMRARILYGQLPGGDKDRTALDMMVGALPSPKGPTFIGKAVFAGGGGKTAEGTEESDTFDGEDDMDDLFPQPAAMQEKLVPIRQRRLESDTK
jgi:hypothetical protein